MNKNLLLSIFAVLASLGLISLIEPENAKGDQFAEWKAVYGWNNLKSGQQEYRKKVFLSNVEKINKHNGLLSRSYDMGVNQFTAFTQQEFEQKFLTKIQPTVSDVSATRTDEPVSATTDVAVNIDWVAAGAVSPVKNEGTCKASYAFSAIGGVEGISVIFFKAQVQYSVQQLVDCSSSYGNLGCNGGNMLNSYKYIVDRGITTETGYPYVGRVMTCSISAGLFKIKSYAAATSCVNLNAVLTTRPVSVALDGRNFNTYHSGIFDNCGVTLTISGLLVGATDTYYKVKNSWGSTWGESGYIRLPMINNICGICLAASYPTP